MSKTINCYICGSWIKPDKHGIYKCPKCKAKYKEILNDDGNKEIARYYENYAEYVED